MDTIESKIREHLRQIGQRSKLLLDERLVPYDITPQQARLIGFVCSEQQQGNITYQKDIEEAFELKGSSVTSLLQGLQRKGFIMRRSDASDERRKVVTVLPKGQELVSKFETVFQEIDEQMVQGLTPEQQQRLVQTLEQMASNLGS